MPFFLFDKNFKKSFSFKFSSLKTEIKYKRSFDEKLARAIFYVSKRYYIVLPISFIITVIAGIGALNLESQFDVKDFFDNNSDFVIGLEKFQEYKVQSIKVSEDLDNDSPPTSKGASSPAPNVGGGGSPAPSSPPPNGGGGYEDLEIDKAEKISL